MPNSAAVIVIAVIPLLAISRPLAKTAASLVVTAPMVTEFALKASSAKNPVTAASASVNVMESIWSALNFAALATIAAFAPVIAPLVTVTESAATPALATKAEKVVMAASFAKVIAVTPPAAIFATFVCSEARTSVFDTEPTMVTEFAANVARLPVATAPLVLPPVTPLVNSARYSASVNSALLIAPAATPTPPVPRLVVVPTASLVLGLTSRVPVPVKPPAS